MACRDLLNSTKQLIKNFVKIYTQNFPVFSSIADWAAHLDMHTIAAQTGAEYFDEQGVTRIWSREVIEAFTRVNYGQVSGCVADFFDMYYFADYDCPHRI